MNSIIELVLELGPDVRARGPWRGSSRRGIGAMGIVVLEWLDGDLDASVEDITDYFVDMLLAAGAAAKH